LYFEGSDEAVGFCVVEGGGAFGVEVLEFIVEGFGALFCEFFFELLADIRVSWGEVGEPFNEALKVKGGAAGYYNGVVAFLDLGDAFSCFCSECSGAVRLGDVFSLMKW